MCTCLGSGEEAIWEDLSLDEYFMGKRNSMKRAQDFLALLFKKKNNENINMKVFSIESKEKH